MENAKPNENSLKSGRALPKAVNDISIYICEFCGKQFSRKGTYGRHLDTKKGDPNHPLEAVAALRSGVVRRAYSAGAKAASDEYRVDKSKRTPQKNAQKKSKSEISKLYNSKEIVKEKNKARRKQRDLRLKAQLMASEWYLSSIAQQGQGQNQGQNQASAETHLDNIATPKSYTEAETCAAKYAFALASHVPLAMWPKNDENPTDDLLTVLIKKITETPSECLRGATLDQVFVWHAHWAKLGPDQKKALWNRNADLALRTYLQNTSLIQVGQGLEFVRAKQRQIYEQLVQGDMSDMIFSGSESNE
ncbi:hypothetical protein OY671_006897 [Metschnikowia pulcherrima]|nr:hypothetical protein OY671_006897 [Metschnikowia pulcherrima]